MLTKDEAIKILNLHQNTETEVYLISKYKFSSEDLTLLVNDAIKNRPLVKSIFHKY